MRISTERERDGERERAGEEDGEGTSCIHYSKHVRIDCEIATDSRFAEWYSNWHDTLTQACNSYRVIFQIAVYCLHG